MSQALDQEKLCRLFGYKSVNALKRCLESQGREYFYGQDGCIVTTTGLMEKAKTVNNSTNDDKWDLE